MESQNPPHFDDDPPLPQPRDSYDTEAEVRVARREHLTRPTNPRGPSWISTPASTRSAHLAPPSRERAPPSVHPIQGLPSPVPQVRAVSENTEYMNIDINDLPPDIPPTPAQGQGQGMAAPPYLRGGIVRTSSPTGGAYSRVLPQGPKQPKNRFVGGFVATLRRIPKAMTPSWGERAREAERNRPIVATEIIRPPEDSPVRESNHLGHTPPGTPYSVPHGDGRDDGDMIFAERYPHSPHGVPLHDHEYPHSPHGVHLQDHDHDHDHEPHQLIGDALSASDDTGSTIEPTRAPDYRRMAFPLSPVTLRTQMRHVQKAWADFNALPFVASSKTGRVAVDYIPGLTSPKPPISESWYSGRRALSLDLLAGGSSVGHLMAHQHGPGLPPPAHAYGPQAPVYGVGPPPEGQRPLHRNAYSLDEQHLPSGQYPDPNLPPPNSGQAGGPYQQNRHPYAQNTSSTQAQAPIYPYPPAQQIYVMQPVPTRPSHSYQNLLRSPDGSVAELHQMMPLYVVAGQPSAYVASPPPGSQIHLPTQGYAQPQSQSQGQQQYMPASSQPYNQQQPQSPHHFAASMPSFGYGPGPGPGPGTGDPGPAGRPYGPTEAGPSYQA